MIFWYVGPLQNQNGSINIILQGEDDDNDTLEYRITSFSQNGVLQGDVPNLTYFPVEDFVGQDSFSYKVYDGNVFSDIVKVLIIVQE